MSRSDTIIVIVAAAALSLLAGSFVEALLVESHGGPMDALVAAVRDALPTLAAFDLIISLILLLAWLAATIRLARRAPDNTTLGHWLGDDQEGSE
ncbi:hypothetical protein [Natronomonas marina]|uniref:hypothetical protein n=1 Tax=Natronomonas marina TaxID=2961939 RepID=UPI0020C94D50|nr:hypothetical protein [Natronomonas marina]